ncbi:MAG: hypothetical protein ACD_75C02599G0001 [uncultured bacterium]|nr:MAG: hypothetical protein ACD_75C02599G0001 [uncultured bacterium]
MKRKVLTVALACSLLATTLSANAINAAETIKVGILHSLSGTMAISETTLKDTMLMLIDEQNKKGGLLGKKLEAVVVDPASNWPLFAEKARELIQKDKVSATFGCWTSVSRKSVLPVFEELNSLLFYPVQYEGEESSLNVFYTGAAPNQQAIPAVDYLMNEIGAKRWVLAGTDYVYPRTTNKILEAYLKAKGVAAEDIMINYTPFGHSDWQSIVADIKKFGSAGKKTAVVSTINSKFIATWKAFIKNDKRVTNDPMEAHYIGFNMWVKAVEKAGTTDPAAVQDAIIGITVPNLSGGYSAMMPNHHITKPVLIGEIQENGQFETVWQTAGLVVGDEWSDYLEGSKDLISDWRKPLFCGSYNVVTHKCSGSK